MSHPMLPAVDELANLRRTLAGLRQRELELCDEIRASATDIGAARVEGNTSMAMIETRRPRQLDISKLPKKVLNNPNMFTAAPQTHVLLWPKSSPAELAATQGAPERVADHGIDQSLGLNTDINDMAFNSDPLLTEAPEIEAPIFDTAGTDAQLPVLDMPSLDTHKIASTAEEIAPPADLLATQYADLQPLGDLTEEDLESVTSSIDQSLPPVVDPDAVLSAEALQAELDTQVENLAALDDEDPAPFMTRRIIGAPV
jgi:hypothetical protein